MVSVRLGELRRIVCASPAYLDRRGRPRHPDELAGHDIIEMPAPDGRARSWRLVKDGRTREFSFEPRVCVNDALTIHRLVVNGAGVGIVSCYLCAPDIEAGHLVELFPDWTVPALEVNMLFPSKRELAPAVRGFVDYMKEVNQPGLHWQNNEIPAVRSPGSVTD
jgi:DNA-binding transcriptional LysR family regulator